MRRRPASHVPWIQLEVIDGGSQAGPGQGIAPHGASRATSGVMLHADHEADYRSRLLMVRRADVVVRLNGTPAPRLCELRLGDQLQLDDRVLMHVTIHQGSSVGPVARELVGKECLVCRVPFETRTQVYLCPHCGVAIHCEDDRDEHSDDRKRQEPLECARLSDACPFCHRPVWMEEGFLYEPTS